jgi:hypothetical protein
MRPSKQSSRDSNLPRPRERLGQLLIRFNGDAADKDHPIHDISATAVSGDALFLAGDEANSVERVVRLEDGSLGNSTSYRLADYLELADPDEEMDIEGLAVADGWLWITGSHARTRQDPKDDGSEPGCIDLAALADLRDTRPRCLLARVPLMPDDHGHPAPVERDGKRRAGLVPQSAKHGSKLARAIEQDALLGPATRLAAKEGGLDIEGLALAGERVALGLRGPVVRTYAVILEPPIVPKKSGKLHLEDAPVIRLVDLFGLGIRDMRPHGRDLYILAGPTADLDGRCAVFRWNGWADDPPADDTVVRLHQPEHLFDLPIRLGCDHAEGIDIWTDHSGNEQLLVLFDSPAPDRLDVDHATLLADLYALD